MDSQVFIKTIQLMIVPVVMISAVGLLLLSISNKNSSINSRLRTLNQERRLFMKKIQEGKELEFLETFRLQSIQKQIEFLLFRLKIVRNTIIFYVVGLFLFILTSLLIGLASFIQINILHYIMVGTFIVGMISIAIGLIFTLFENLHGYKVLVVEIKAEE